MFCSPIVSILLALIGTPSPPTPSNDTASEPEQHGSNYTLAKRDRPIGYFGPIRGLQYQLRVNAYRADEGGCAWPDGRHKNYMGGVNVDMKGRCENFNFRHHDLSEMISMSLPTKWAFPQTKHCEVAFYQQRKCEGVLMGFLTERDARSTESNCFELLGSQSLKAVCGENWWDVWDNAGVPWMDPNSPWYLDDRDEWLLDASSVVFGKKEYFRDCHPGDVACVLWPASTATGLKVLDRDGTRGKAWFDKMESQGKKLDFSKDRYRECDWNGRCGMMCPNGEGHTVLCDDDLRKTPWGEEFPYDQAWEIASPRLPGNTLGNQKPFGVDLPS